MKTTATLIAVSAALLGASPPVGADTPPRHAAHLSTLLTELGTARSGTTTFVGLTRGAPIGPGTVRIDANVSSSPFHYRIELFSPSGSMKGRGTATLVQKPDDTNIVTGTGRITSGTNRFKGATSRRLHVTGIQSPNDNIMRVTISGSVSY